MPREIRIDKLDRSTQVRAAMCQATIADYADADSSGENLPAIDVFDDGKVTFVAAGHHRIMAREANGKGTVLAEVHKGTRADAIRFGCGDNARHGLRMTTADKIHAIRLYATTFPEEPVNAIAKACGVSWTLADKTLNPASYSEDGRKKLPARESEPAERGDAWEPPSGAKPDLNIHRPQEEATDRQAAAPRQPKSEPPVLDCRGKAVPAHLRDAFGSTWHQDVIDRLTTFATQIESVGKWNSFLDVGPTLDALASVQDRIVNSKPFAICPNCKARPNGCDLCCTLGWVPEGVESNFATRKAA